MQGDTRDGGFETLRLAAALAVFHGHSFAIAGLPEPQAPGLSWAGAAIVVLFALSGHWVTRSAVARSVAGYAAARALRILPALAVNGLVTIAICALATSLVVNDYFRQADTWRWLQNALPVFMPQRTTLPGVFEDGALHHPNGALWTLPYGVLCYVVAGVAARFGPQGLRYAIAFAAIFAVGYAFGPIGEGTVRLLAAAFEHRWLAVLGGAFFLGAALRAASSRTLLATAAAAAVAAVLAGHHQAAALAAGVFLYAASAVWVGRNLNLDRIVTRGRDIAFGVYIYAFPVTQLAVRLVRPHDAASYALYWALALAVTLILAWLSWRLVEKPALAAKARVAGLVERGLGRLRFPAMRARPAT